MSVKSEVVNADFRAETFSVDGGRSASISAAADLNNTSLCVSEMRSLTARSAGLNCPYARR